MASRLMKTSTIMTAMKRPHDQDIKAYINRYFSDELQHDETPAAAMERLQLRKWMLWWAKDYTVSQSVEPCPYNDPNHI